MAVLVEGAALGSGTNTDGTFSIPRVPAGLHTLVVSFGGYTAVRQEFSSR